VKDAAQHVAENVTQHVAGGVLGAAEDGNLKVFVIFRGGTHAQHTHAAPPALPLGDT